LTSMRAAVTVGPRSIDVVERPEPPPPGEGSTLLRVETVGICGSDLHFYTGALGARHERLRPRVQGHEFSAVVEAVDPAGSPFDVGDRVAVWPVTGCGRCRSCTAARPNVCSELDLIGVHHDGALQDLVLVDTANVVLAGDLDRAQTALVEPASIAIHTVARAAVRPEEQVVVFGAGPIGFATAIAARDRGGRITLVDPVDARRDLVARVGFETETPDSPSLALLCGGAGPHTIIDTTGRPEVLQRTLDLAANGGRVVVVGLTGASAPVCSGTLPHKELDVLGVSCCVAEEFAAAVELVRAHRGLFDTFVSHTFPLDRVDDAFALLEQDPGAAYKLLIDLRAESGATP
ncbi:MAG: alcohol dehydrogenase catalytic domain-containing protein, partial [Ilumatobacteraceae bacterium]